MAGPCSIIPGYFSDAERIKFCVTSSLVTSTHCFLLCSLKSYKQSQFFSTIPICKAILLSPFNSLPSPNVSDVLPMMLYDILSLS